ncbi:MAG: hypothetical protein GKR93_11555 [Gammaproteobacteria bacterium]|nr:hypothetical protein [Gammaproteobacteria bacterium]
MSVLSPLQLCIVCITLTSTVTAANTFAAPGSPDSQQQEYSRPDERLTASFDNLRWVIDQSTRHNVPLSGGNSFWQHAIGLDLHKVFQNEYGDYGTLIFQPFLVRVENLKNPPAFFDDGNDWALNWRMINFNYTALAKGKFNIRLGHFEVPFGLEQNIDTNGTLRQYTFSTRAIKADWGFSVNGALNKLDYEFALSRGSGNDYSSRHNPYLFSGRIGTPVTKNLVFGVSGFFGETLQKNGTTNRKLLAVDLAYYFYQWEFLLELSGGDVDDDTETHILTEASWRSPMESLHLYSQFRNSSKKFSGQRTSLNSITVGIHYDFTSSTGLSGEIRHNFDAALPNQQTSNLLLQLRVRI